MKYNIKSVFPFALTLCFYFLVCILFSVLYTLDWVSTSVFQMLCFLASCFLYGIFGWMFVHFIKKRQFVIALCCSFILLILKFIFKDSASNLISYSIRLLMFLSTVIFFQTKNNS